MHKTLLKNKHLVSEMVNKKIEAIHREVMEDMRDGQVLDEDQLEELEDCMCILECIASICKDDHEMRMDHHEMAMKGNPVPHAGNPTSAAVHPVHVRDMSTIDGPHSHGVASFTLGTM